MPLFFSESQSPVMSSNDAAISNTARFLCVFQICSWTSYMRLCTWRRVWQSGQICSTSLQESTQRGIKQHGQALDWKKESVFFSHINLTNLKSNECGSLPYKAKTDTDEPHRHAIDKVHLCDDLLVAMRTFHLHRDISHPWDNNYFFYKCIEEILMKINNNMIIIL